MVAWELWRLARASGTRPFLLAGRRLAPWRIVPGRTPVRYEQRKRHRRELTDREALAFDLTVMRGHDKARNLQFALTMQRLAPADRLGAAIQMLYEAL